MDAKKLDRITLQARREVLVLFEQYDQDFYEDREPPSSPPVTNFFAQRKVLQEFLKSLQQPQEVPGGQPDRRAHLEAQLGEEV